MTELLYSKDSYLKEFDSTVLYSKGNLVELEKTAFYYTSGGQPSDLGKIIAEGAEFAVLDVYKDKETGKILHKLDKPLGIVTMVRGEIDWNRRHMHMRYHTALHVLSRVVLEEFGNFVTSSQIYENRARIDFDCDEMTQEKIKLIEEKTNAAINRNLPVTISFIQREDAIKLPDLIRTKVNLVPESVAIIRVIKIDGLDQQACGGTHVKNTSEIGTLKITKTESKGALRRRLEINLMQ